MKAILRLAILTLAFTHACMAMFVQPEAFPLDRIVQNTQAYLNENPNDADAIYTLARAHYLAFINRSSMVPMMRMFNDEPPKTAPDFLVSSNYKEFLLQQEVQRLALADMKRQAEQGFPDGKPDLNNLTDRYRSELEANDWKPERLSAVDAVQFAAVAQEQFNHAISLEPDNALYHLGLASLKEQVLAFGKEHDVETNAFVGLDQKKVFDSYWTAFRLSQPVDSKLKHRPISGIKSIISYEAGKACLRLGRASTEQQGIIRHQIDQMEKLDMYAITPLVIPPRDARSSKDFVLQSQTVTFDLDGLGPAEWGWVTPATAILVWDPLQRGEINSAAQLFGNYTFRMIWRDGFHALSVLDDNRDGQITGAELIGLSLWHDQNSNGISDQGEVRPIGELGVHTLHVDGVKTVDGMPVRKHGVIYEDGSTGHLWDWIARQKGNRLSPLQGAL